MKTNASSAILRRIRAHGRGWAFTASDFLDVGSRAAVDQSLSRLRRSGEIRLVARGLYDFPRAHQRFGLLPPNADAVVQALARRSGSEVQITGAQAANALGLSTQVPAQTIFLTNGPGRRISIGRSVIRLKHVSPKKLIAAGSPAGTAFQALRYLGRDGADALAGVANARLSVRDKKALTRRARLAPGWMQPTLRRIGQANAGPGDPSLGAYGLKTD